uniref:Uncharacterized protein n=1 Tax=Ascaris lumbricoides TaxID=6252 RepID=A0A0M3IQZ4_ASCLU
MRHKNFPFRWAYTLTMRPWSSVNASWHKLCNYMSIRMQLSYMTFSSIACLVY